MKWFSDVSELPSVYLHRRPVDFRKAVNGLCVIVEQEMGLSPYDASLYVFCNRSKDKLKILHWDRTGFVLWYKRLEKEKFKWPLRDSLDVICVDSASFHWLLSGLEIYPPRGHTPLYYQSVS